jgi:hypothetical protein
MEGDVRDSCSFQHSVKSAPEVVKPASIRLAEYIGAADMSGDSSPSPPLPPPPPPVDDQEEDDLPF